MHNTISEAFYRLDFYNAIHDIRRFNYICKLLHLLITQNLTSLSGCATRVLFTMLEQVAWEVWSNKRNIHVIRNLLDELKQTIQKYYCWGRPIGSSLLWQQHFETIERISQIVNGIEISPVSRRAGSRVACALTIILASITRAHRQTLADQTEIFALTNLPANHSDHEYDLLPRTHLDRTGTWLCGENDRHLSGSLRRRGANQPAR